MPFADRAVDGAGLQMKVVHCRATAVADWRLKGERQIGCAQAACIAATIHNVRLQDIHRSVLQQFAKPCQSAQALSRCDLNSRLLAEVGCSLGIVVARGLFNESYIIRRAELGKSERLLRIEFAIDVDGDLDTIANRLADSPDAFGVFAQRRRHIRKLMRPFAGDHADDDLDAPETLIDPILGPGCELLPVK